MIMLMPFPIPDDISPSMLVTALQPHIVDGGDISDYQFDSDCNDDGDICLNDYCERINDTYRQHYKYINIIGYEFPSGSGRYKNIGLKVEYGN